MAAAFKYCTNPSEVEVAEYQEVRGAPSPRSYCEGGRKIQISQPTPFGGPTAQTESPRRALAIRAAEGEIAEGLQQNDANLRADRV